jgi:hypothetical protein
MARKDYIPENARNQRDWGQNFLAHFPAIGKRIGMGDPAIEAIVQRVTLLNTSAQVVVDADANRDIAQGQYDAVCDAQLSEVRLDVANLKRARGFTEGDAKSLDILASAATFDPATYQPRLQVEEKRGRVTLMARKNGADTLNIHTRRKGEGTFRLLAGKRSRFPFDDDTPSANGQPEEREYQAIGVQGDDEIGKPSDIVSAVWRP